MNSYLPYLLNRFKKVSKVYDFITFLLPDSLRKVTVKLSGVNSKSKVIDVCTGTGNLAIEFGKYANEVIGVDISPDMLEIARSKNSKVKFILMDATKLEFLDKSFDIASIVTALHEMPKEVREKVLNEIKRVTKDKVVIVDYVAPKNPLLRSLYIKLISLYESKYFNEFVNDNIEKLITKCGLTIELQKKLFGLFSVFVCKP